MVVRASCFAGSPTCSCQLESFGATVAAAWTTSSVESEVNALATFSVIHQSQKHGAHVAAIARPSGKWLPLLETARQSAGTLTYPMADGSEGADAMESTPELANWLASLYPTKQLVICSYIYQGAACLPSHPVGLF